MGMAAGKKEEKGHAHNNTAEREREANGVEPRQIGGTKKERGKENLEKKKIELAVRV